MTNFLLFGFALAGLLTLASYAGAKRYMEDACLLSGIWVGLSSFIALTEIYEPWSVSMFVDIAAAYWLVSFRWSRFHIPLVLSFMLQATMHIAFGGMELANALQLTKTNVDYDLYYNTVGAVGWLQLLYVGGGALVRISRDMLVPDWLMASLYNRRDVVRGRDDA